jgi:hypothetical protein
MRLPTPRRWPDPLMPRSLAALAALSALTGAAHAADRAYTLTDFERIRIVGPFIVEVETGKGVSVRASGSTAALDRVDAQVQGRQLTIRINKSTWGGWSNQTPPAPARIRITVPQLNSVGLQGDGTLTINRMEGQRLTVALDGSGSVSVGALDTDRLDASAFGSGTMTIAGRAATANLLARGSGTIDAAKLATRNGNYLWQSAGQLTAQASQTAKVTATGPGNVVVSGAAACTVNAVGAGTVRCGKPSPTTGAE